MSEPIVYIDRSEIRPGKVEEVRKAVSELVEFAHSNESQLLSYGFFFDREAAQMTCIAVHPDSASMEFHMKTAGPLFAHFAGLINMYSIEVYGEPSDSVIEQLEAKVKMLGERGVLIRGDLQAGFARFGSLA